MQHKRIKAITNKVKRHGRNIMDESHDLLKIKEGKMETVDMHVKDLHTAFKAQNMNCNGTIANA